MNDVIIMMKGHQDVWTKECVMKLNVQWNDVTIRRLVAGILYGVDILIGIDVVMSLDGTQITSTDEPTFVMQFL
jgi:hypothetical protein